MEGCSSLVVHYCVSTTYVGGASKRALCLGTAAGAKHERTEASLF